MDKVVHKMFIGNSVSIPIQLEEELVTSTNNFKIALTQLNLYLSPIEMNDYRRLFMNFFGIGPYVERWKLSDDNVEEQQNSAILVKYLQHILLDNATAIEAIGYSTRRMFHS
jgi:hypothetical protein